MEKFDVNVTLLKSPYALESFALRALCLSIRDHVNPPEASKKKEIRLSFTLTNKASKRAVTLFSSLNLMIHPQLKAPPTE